MARRSSGWTIVKGIAREIDRANRQAQKAAIARERAYERDVARSNRELEKLRNKLDRLEEKFNATLNAANEASSISVKEKKLSEARRLLEQLREIELYNPAVSLGNLREVEESIDDVQGEIDELIALEREKQSQEEDAVRRTEAAQRLRDDIAKILTYTLMVDDALNWKELRDKQQFLIPKPVKPQRPTLPAKPTLKKSPRQPEGSDKSYQPKIPIYAHLMPQKKRALKAEAREQFERDHLNWREQVDQVEHENQRKLGEWEREKDALLGAWSKKHEKALEDWNLKKKAHSDAQAQYNGGLDTLRHQYEQNEPAAIAEYCRLVLARSDYPFAFSKDFQIEYDAEAHVLAIDYHLPSIDVVPDLKEERFIKSRSEVKRTSITEKQRRDIYETLLYAMILRTIHELFEADTANAIEAIAMNGWATGLNKATGHEVTSCIATISVTKKVFLEINLANVNEKECFKSLKGIGGAKLSELVPVAPVISLNRNDGRFVEGYAVAQHIVEGDNLAMMNWEDFEHLIRELFEKEFSANGSEVRVTQASRDGGVDAVVFDPHPIRGGKIVIQAKRYTNTVGVSAVRDLYGTLQHEGAMKGILITTSSYGSDAYEFAKGKPLTLMNGENLIYLLERHGHKARIDLVEAKKLAQG
ncbi:MAG: restriction endonuclease [Alphaproteobacteria bacterium]|nr:MAG: restriction endonuclease [Alphaproteobacteria bacterium]